MKKLIFSDYDGTFTDHEELHGVTAAIVTGTSWEDFQRLLDDVQLITQKSIPVFFNPVPKDKVDLLNVVQHKANVINLAGATDYYENQKDQADLLKVMCPKCTIHYVKEEETLII